MPCMIAPKRNKEYNQYIVFFAFTIDAWIVPAYFTCVFYRIII